MRTLMLSICISLLPFSSLAKTPVINLDTEELRVEQFDQDILDIPVSFESTKNVRALKLKISPELHGIVSVTPSAFEHVKKGHQYQVMLSVNHMQGTSDTPILGYLSIYKKTKEKDKPKNLANPLSITIIPSSVSSELPPMPGPENDLSVQGVDADNDGIRDDVQHYLYQHYHSEKPFFIATLDLARIYQRILIEAESKEASTKNLDLLENALACAYYLEGMKAYEVAANISAETNNTLERVTAYSKFHDQTSNIVTYAKSSTEKAKSCPSEVIQVLEEQQ
ncbi:hypothetical protein JCM19236_5038 [Vibrio sp. JCM 19236]|nr:hypothetical protein JCM19236_5038 [Vibrio sp. JCM 19236]